MRLTTGRSACAATVLSVVLVGCLHNPPKTSDGLKSWFDVQKEYAAVLDEQFGKNSVYRVVPVIGPIYKVGSPLRPGTPSLITNACSVEETLPEEEMGLLPLVKANKTFGIGLSMPEAIQNLFKNVAEFGVKVDVSNAIELNYTNLKHKSLSEADVKRALKRPKCRDAIKNLNIVLVRGYIRGSLKASSDSTVEVDPKAKIARVGEFNVKYVERGGFSIEDIQPRPHFMVVTQIQAITIHVPTSTHESVKHEEPKKSADYDVATSSAKKEIKYDNKKDTKKSANPAGGKSEEIIIKYSRPTSETINALYSAKTK